MKDVLYVLVSRVWKHSAVNSMWHIIIMFTHLSTVHCLWTSVCEGFTGGDQSKGLFLWGNDCDQNDSKVTYNFVCQKMPGTCWRLACAWRTSTKKNKKTIKYNLNMHLDIDSFSRMSMSVLLLKVQKNLHSFAKKKKKFAKITGKSWLTEEHNEGCLHGWYPRRHSV